jgi:uncharacterized protein (DUF362 family)
MLKNRISRRDFVKSFALSGAAAWATLTRRTMREAHADPGPAIYVVRDIPVPSADAAYHAGVDALLDVLGFAGRKFYRSSTVSLVSGPDGMISADDIVLVKVNAQWKYRGCTNSDVVKGVIQRVLDHPDGFTGEVVVFENGQGRGSLDCDTIGGGYEDTTMHANAEDESHSFSYLVNTVFAGHSVSEYLLDPIRSNFIGGSDHSSQGYRQVGNVSYPCFTTTGGNRVELRDGLWTGSGYADKLKLINIPVLKHHGGCATTGALKHFYGVLSMQDGGDAGSRRHYGQIGNDCADMWCDVKTPVVTILDCIWVSPGALAGYPESATVRTNMLLAGFDPVALDYWASKHVLYPAGGDSYHNPDTSSDLQAFLSQAMQRINTTYGGIDGEPATMTESAMTVLQYSLADSDSDGVSDVYEETHGMDKLSSDSDGDLMPDGYEVGYGLDPTANDAGSDLDGDGFSNYEEYLAGSPPNNPNWTPETPVRATGIAGTVILGAAALAGGLLAASGFAKRKLGGADESS